jgi:S-adenosylmethionine decarboxylase
MSARDQPVLFSVDLTGCAAIGTLGPDAIADTFIDALKTAGATVVQTLSHSFPGAGLTCILILAESHAALHTWPETETVNIDIFSCSTRLRTLAAIEALGRSFGATSVSVQEIPRADGHLPSDRRA